MNLYTQLRLQTWRKRQIRRAWINRIETICTFSMSRSLLPLPKRSAIPCENLSRMPTASIASRHRFWSQISLWTLINLPKTSKDLKTLDLDWSSQKYPQKEKSKNLEVEIAAEMRVSSEVFRPRPKEIGLSNGGRITAKEQEIWKAEDQNWVKRKTKFWLTNNKRLNLNCLNINNNNIGDKVKKKRKNVPGLRLMVNRAEEKTKQVLCWMAVWGALFSLSSLQIVLQDHFYNDLLTALHGWDIY